MDALINTTNFQVNINGNVYQARHINHTSGPAMYFGTVDRVFCELIDAKAYKECSQQAELNALVEAVRKNGYNPQLCTMW